MNASNPDEIKEKATEYQRRMIAETRDCTDPECSGILDRTEMTMHDGMIVEEYTHKGGGSDDCECVETEQGRTGIINPDELVVQHYRGRSRGSGPLKGEF